jgi:pre-60S factor REI1
MAVSNSQSLKHYRLTGLASVYNLQRHVAGQAAVSEEEYDAQIHSQETTPRHKDSGEDQDRKWLTSYSSDVQTVPSVKVTPSPAVRDTLHKIPPPTRCLLCSLVSQDLEANIEHMSSQHGLFIPSPNRISDLESFLEYLGIIVFEYNECLYCGLEKSTVDAVQTHMRDKGHCNLSTKSELLAFWGLSDGSEEEKEEEDHDNEWRSSNKATKLSRTEMRLPSGLIINSRSTNLPHPHAQPSRQRRWRLAQPRTTPRPTHAITAAQAAQILAHPSPLLPTPQNHDHRIATRHTMGLAGVPESQLRTLATLDKRMKKRESVCESWSTT